MSGASSRRRGNVAEVAVANWLRAHGWDAITSRNARGGSQQGADIITDFPAAVEVKDQARFDLAGWVDQARSQADDCAAVVVAKRRGRADVGEWYAVMSVADLVRLVREAECRPYTDAEVKW